MELDVNWKGCQVKEWYEVVNIVFIHSEGVFGSVEKLGAFASNVTYNKDGIEYNELLENEEFSVVDEIVFKRVEEENNG